MKGGGGTGHRRRVGDIRSGDIQLALSGQAEGRLVIELLAVEHDVLQVHGLAFIAADHAALDEVLQFADVTREVVGEQCVDQAGGEAADLALVQLAVTLQEVIHQQRDVFPAFAQARNLDGVNVEPVEQVLTKTAGLDLVAQLYVGGSDQPHINADGFVAADPLDLAFLQGPEALALGVKTEGGDLIEEQRAAVGALEAPGAAAVGAGVGALFAAGEFGLDQAPRPRGADEADQRAMAARAVSVQVLGKELLAHPGFTGQQYRGLGWSYPLQHALGTQEGRGVAEHVRVLEIFLCTVLWLGHAMKDVAEEAVVFRV